MPLKEWLKVLTGLCTCLSLLLMLIRHQEENLLTRDYRIPSLRSLALISSVTSHPDMNLTQKQCITDFAFSPTVGQENTNELRHVAFLKVHKAASTTLFNLFFRFGRKRQLTFIVPRSGHTIGGRSSMRKRQVFPPWGNKTFDIICLHAIFEKEIYESYLPNDTVYIASIREPLDRLISAFWYYRNTYDGSYLRKVPGPDVLQRFLLDPVQYDEKDPFDSNTNNRMAVDFGFPPGQFHNISHFKEYLTIIDSRFDLIMDLNLFPESVILMKRRLNWSLEDVVYLSQNRIERKPFFFTREMHDAAKTYLKLDYILYKHFTRRLRSTIRKQDKSFFQEVENLVHVQSHVQEFCSDNDLHDVGKKLVVSESRWNKRFVVDFCVCSIMMLKEIPAVKVLQRVMKQNLDKYGPNRDFFLSRTK